MNENFLKEPLIVKKMLEGEKAIKLWLKGKTAWNNWADEHEGWSVIFKGTNFNSHRVNNKDQIIDFSGFKFPGSAIFENCIFGDGGVDFKYSVFCGGKVSFSGADFGNGFVSFKYVCFISNFVDFSHVEFGDGEVDFASANFGFEPENFCKSTFQNATFGNGDVIFQNAIFWNSGGSGDSEICFTGVNFGAGDIDFSGVNFGMGNVLFDKTVFYKGNIYFINAKFGERNVAFADANLGGGYIYFTNADFSNCFTNFGSANFGKAEVVFDRANFSQGAISFNNASFGEGRLSFGSIILLNCKEFVISNAVVDSAFILSNIKCPTVINLCHSKLTHPIDLDNTEIEFQIEEYLRFFKRAVYHKDSTSFRRLKKLAIASGDHDSALDFYAKEKRSAYWHTIKGPKLFLYYLYDWLSNYGRSIFRPALGLAVCWVIFACIYLGISNKDWDFDNFDHAAIYSVGHTLPFNVGAKKSNNAAEKNLYGKDTEPEDIPVMVHYATIAQGFVSPIFLFLLALGFRNRFRT